MEGICIMENNIELFDLPYELANKLTSEGCDKDLAESISTCYDSLIDEYGEEYKNIIQRALLSCKYVIANDNKLNDKGKKTKIIEDVDYILDKEGIPKDFVDADDLKSDFIYASYPHIADKRITKIDRIIVLPKYFNSGSYSSIGMLVNALNRLISSYVNEYKILNNKIIKRNGLAKYEYDLDTHRLITKSGYGLNKGINSYEEMAIIRKYFDEDETYSLSDKSDNILLAGVLMDGDIDGNA